MFRRIKELILPISKSIPSYTSLTKANPPHVVSFKSIDDSINMNLNAEKENISKDKQNGQGECLMQPCQERKLNMPTTLIYKILSTMGDLVPGIPYPHQLMNLTDLRTRDERSYMTQAVNNEDLQINSICQEQPRPLVYEELATNDTTKRCLSKNTTEKTHSEYELQMQKMLRNISQQRELRMNKNVEKDTRDNQSDFVNIDTVIKKENEQRSKLNSTSEVDVKQRHLQTKKDVEKDSQDNQSDVVNIDTVIKKENEQRSKLNSTSDDDVNNYITDMLKMNRILEHKIMKSKQERTEELTKPNDFKESQHNSMAKGDDDASPTEVLDRSTVISHQKLKLEQEMNKIFKDLLKARTLALKEFETNKIQTDRRGIIDINAVVDHEEKIRDRKTRNENSKPVYAEMSKMPFTKPKDVILNKDKKIDNAMNSETDMSWSMTNPPYDYLKSMIETNRILEIKMMKSKSKNPIESYEVKKPKTN